MDKSIESIFDECIKLINAEHPTIEDCLAMYPENAAELKKLLTFSQALKPLHQIEPSQAFLENAEKNLTQKLTGQSVTIWTLIRRTLQRRNLTTLRRLTMAQFLITLMMLISLATGGVYASHAAEPGDFLYDINLNVQQIRFLFTTKPESVVAARLEFAEQRLLEAVSKLENNEVNNANIAFDAYDSEISELAKFIAGQEGLDQDALGELVDEALSIHQRVLNELLDWVPEEARPAIEKALIHSLVEIELPEGPPFDVPDGPPEGLPVGPPEGLPVGPPDGLPVDPPVNPPVDLPVNPPVDPPVDLPGGKP